MADAAMPEEVQTAAAGTSGFLNPARIIERLDLRPGMVVADFGSGGGYLTLPAARRVGENGRVYAIDIQQPTIELIRSKAALEHLLNIEAVWADLERPRGSHLPENAADFVFIANILFQAEDKGALLTEAKRVLRTGGAMLILEWDDTPFPVGPPATIRVPKQTARHLAEGIGFTFEKEIEAGSHHYGLLFKKQ